MNDYKIPRLNEDEILSSQSSDEKMDTGTESFRSQGTPNSVLSSDFDDRDHSIEQNNVLRLQNPETNSMSNVLRLSEPDNENKTVDSKLKQELSDNLVSKMSTLNLDSSVTENVKNRPRNLGISPPKFSSTLTLTTDHPLMGLTSPDGNYPDVIPKKTPKIEDEKDLSLSSIEDERPANDTNGFELYGPQRNTSKNNLYFTENFVANNQISNDTIDLTSPPDVARVKVKRRKIVARVNETPKKPAHSTPHIVLGRVIDGKQDEGAIIKYVEERNKKISSQSTPKNSFSDAMDITAPEEFHSAVSEWRESPSHYRTMPNFELPIEMSANIRANNDLDSPDLISSSTQEDKSAYQALLDPYTGSVALRQTVARSPGTQRRKIQLPPDDDHCSLDSISASSMESDEEPPELTAPEPTSEGEDRRPDPSHDDDTKGSSKTVSECSELIPEYSAADELRDERSWLSISRGPGSHVLCDMKVIEPYKRVISHGGYDGLGAALIVFSACHLPDSARPDYTYVMDNLFLYVIWTLERLVTDEYVLVYLHGSAGRRRLPTFHWLHECYKLIDRRLRKSLKQLYLVHPTFWLKSFVILTKPFVSSKFFRKLHYVRSLKELMERVPVEPNAIPELVKQYDAGKR